MGVRMPRELSQMEDMLLSSLVKGVNGVLRENMLAHRLLDLVESGNHLILKRKNLVLQMLSAQTAHKDRCSDAICHEPVFRDMRFRYMALRNVKKYPGSDKKTYYGLSFCKGERPVSAVFLGFNGVGKTSLFAALEYMGMGDMKTALVRGFNRKIGQTPDASGSLEMDQSKFLMHCGSSPSDARIVVKTMSEDLSVEGIGRIGNIRYPVVSDSFYCSDYDVRQLEVYEDYSEFLLSQLGLKDMSECLQLLYYMGHHVMKRHEKKYSYNDSLWEEPLYRMLVGMTAGVAVCDADAVRNLAEDVMRVNINPDMTVQEIMDGIDSLVCIIEKLRGCFCSSWYTAGIDAWYGRMVDVCKRMSRQLQSGDCPDDLMQYVGMFRVFHESLVSDVKELGKKRLAAGQEWSAYVEAIVGKYCKYRIRREEFEKLEKEEASYGNLEASDGGFQLLLNDYRMLTKYIEDEIRDRLKEWLEPVSQSIVTLLEEYFSIDNDRIEIRHGFTPLREEDDLLMIPYTKDRQEGYRPFFSFAIRIRSSGGDFDKKDPDIIVSPGAYLNTFKYKLFCVGLKLLLCCMSKVMYRVNYPLVIDDVFDSSDFEHRVRIREFVAEMKRQHDAMLSRYDAGKEGQYDLQVIFFTQDDLIAEQFFKGLCEGHGMESVRFGHIFDYHEMEKLETNSEGNETRDCECFEYGSEGNRIDFVNLADNIF